MLPQKLFFRIGEVAGLVGVEPHVLRYWEREFRSIRPTKSAKGQRVYSRKDVENLLRVRDLLYRDGFTIAGAKKKLQRGDVESGEPEAPSSVPHPSMGTLSGPHEYMEPLGGERTSARAARIEREDAQPLCESAVESSSMERAVEIAPASSGPRQRTESSPELDGQVPDAVREKLLALRSEVEAFLAELSSSPQPRADSRR